MKGSSSNRFNYYAWDDTASMRWYCSRKQSRTLSPYKRITSIWSMTIMNKKPSNFYLPCNDWNPNFPKWFFDKKKCRHEVNWKHSNKLLVTFTWICHAWKSDNSNNVPIPSKWVLLICCGPILNDFLGLLLPSGSARASVSIYIPPCTDLSSKCAKI